MSRLALTAARYLGGIARPTRSVCVTRTDLHDHAPTRFGGAIRWSTSVSSSGSSTAFERAKEKLGSLKKDPGNATKLRLYALFKQATVGPCEGKRPGMTDFVGRAKWDAWSALGTATKEEAQRMYVEVVDGLAAAEGSPVAAAAAGTKPTEGGAGGEADVLTEVKDKMHIITLNRPTKKNAIKFDMYDLLIDALDRAAKDDSTFAVITGSGNFYCSGNDLSNFLNIKPADMQAAAERGRVILQKFVAAFIDFPKPLIAVVNGPAVGIAVTTLGLFDAVYATDRATFHTPFTHLGLAPEGCSSYTFPAIMGHAHACDVLLFNRKLTAAEAAQRGLVTEVFPDESFQREVWERLRAQAKLAPMSLRLSKGLVRAGHAKTLHEVNERECAVLQERWVSEEGIAAVMKFFQAKQ